MILDNCKFIRITGTTIPEDAEYPFVDPPEDGVYEEVSRECFMKHDPDMFAYLHEGKKYYYYEILFSDTKDGGLQAFSRYTELEEYPTSLFELKDLFDDKEWFQWLRQTFDIRESDMCDGDKFAREMSPKELYEAIVGYLRPRGMLDATWTPNVKSII